MENLMRERQPHIKESARLTNLELETHVCVQSACETYATSGMVYESNNQIKDGVTWVLTILGEGLKPPSMILEEELQPSPRWKVAVNDESFLYWSAHPFWPLEGGKPIWHMHFRGFEPKSMKQIDLVTNFWVGLVVRCRVRVKPPVPGQSPLFSCQMPPSAPAGRMGECIHFYKNFSKRPFYDGSSLLTREWGCSFSHFRPTSLWEGSELPKVQSKYGFVASRRHSDLSKAIHGMIWRLLTSIQWVQKSFQCWTSIRASQNSRLPIKVTPRRGVTFIVIELVEWPPLLRKGVILSSVCVFRICDSKASVHMDLDLLSICPRVSKSSVRLDPQEGYEGGSSNPFEIWLKRYVPIPAAKATIRRKIASL